MRITCDKEKLKKADQEARDVCGHTLASHGPPEVSIKGVKSAGIRMTVPDDDETDGEANHDSEGAEEE